MMDGLLKQPMKYSVLPRRKKPFFRQAYVVYDVVQHYQEWYDPSYGNGGGDYRWYSRVLITYKSLEEATSLVKALS